MNHNSSGTGEGTASERLIRAVCRVLRPLIRMLLSHGLTYTWLADQLKGIYVDVAERDFPIEGKRQTDSRISLLTGVHRKDVRRLREEGGMREERMPKAISLGAQLVARWVTTPDFLDEEGMPRPLARLASQGGAHSFEALVASVSKDIRARAVLDEWLRLGVALLDDTDRVILNAEAFVPARGFEEKVFYFGHNMHDHMAAATGNVLGEEPPRLERSVHYDTLTPEAVVELERMAQRLGMQALKALNRRAAELAARDADDPDATQRMNFGVYFYRAPMNSDVESGDGN